MSDDLNPEVDGVPDKAHATKPTSAARVPFTVEMVELDNNPIVLQPKSY